MVTLKDILEAVAGVIAKGYPDRYIYLQQMPDQFERPSFFLELITTHRRRQNIGTDETEIYLTLVIHEPLNDVRKGDPLDALADQETVLELFRTGVLPVADRALPVMVSNGGQSGGEAYVEFTVTLRDGGFYDPEACLALIEEVDMRYKTRKGEVAVGSGEA